MSAERLDGRVRPENNISYFSRSVLYCDLPLLYDTAVRGGIAVDSLVFAVLCAGVFVLFIAVKFALQVRANNRRRARGEEPKRYGDATDGPPPVNVIDWTKK